VPLFVGFIASQLMTFAGLAMRDDKERNDHTSNKNGE